MATRKSNKTAHVLSLITNNKAADSPEEMKEASISKISNPVPIQSPEISNQAPVQAPEISNQVPIQTPEISNEAPVQTPEISNQAPVQTPEISNEAPVQMPEISNQAPMVSNQASAVQQATLPILEISSKGNDAISDLIKEKLTEQFGEQLEKKSTLDSTSQSLQTSNQATQLKATILKESTDDENFSSSKIASFQPLNFDELGGNKETMSTNEDLSNDVIENKSIQNKNIDLKSPLENTSTFKMPDQKHIDDKSYCYVNVIEKIVKDKIEDFMKRFEMCTCSRCVADTIALTLTNLQPKYIVTSQENYFPLLNYYGNKFFASVTAELLKACMIVHENPHHEYNER